MSTPAKQIDLPGLQSRLDALRDGEHLSLAIADVRRIFGLNDIATERMTNFAIGHGCVAIAAPSMITFRKLGASRRS